MHLYTQSKDKFLLVSTLLRLECNDDQVVEKKAVVTCSPLGWGPHQSSQALTRLPACRPNPCPDLRSKKMKHGAWECRNQNTTKSCKNHRTGELCLLTCEKQYQVQEDTTRPVNIITYMHRLLCDMLVCAHSQDGHHHLRISGVTGWSTTCRGGY